MCARNSEGTIAKAIKSILNQNFPHESMEILFVDDGSEDRTLAIIQEYASKTDIATRIFSEGWFGLGRARNTILNNAQGEYVMWIDSDEIIERNFVRKQFDIIECYPRAGILTAILTITRKEQLVLLLELLPNISEYATQNWLKSWKLPGTGGATYRLEAAKQVGGFNEKIRGACEDIDMAWRMRQAGWQIIRGNAYFYESHGSLSSWKDLLKRYVYHGVEARQLYSINRLFLSIYKINPLASFISGIFYASLGYRLTHRKVSLLLPFHYTLKMIAWFYGFTKKMITIDLGKPDIDINGQVFC